MKDEPKEMEKPRQGFSANPFSSNFNTSKNPTQSLPSAAFGKSSLNFGSSFQQQPNESMLGAERKFGSSSHDTSAFSGGKIFN